MAFEENKHPRDKNGQFTSKGSGASTGSTKTSTPKQKVDYDEDYERSWGPANDEEIEKIEIDADYERSYGEAPDPEEDPNGYKKYVESYKKWLKNGESSIVNDDAWENWEEWDEFDSGKTHGYASVKDYKRSQEILDEMNALRKGEREEGNKLTQAWAVDKTMPDKEFREKSDKLHKETQEKGDALYKELHELTNRAKDFQKQYNERKKAKDEKERKQAYKLFDLDF